MSATGVRRTSGEEAPTTPPVLRFGILGTLEVDSDGRSVDLGGPKQRTVLAYLIARANLVVPVETLKECLWGEEPPESAGNVLQTYVSHLRRAIGRERIVGQAAGYRLLIEPSELDASVFESLTREGRAALTEAPEIAAGQLEAALRLWRGPALANVRDDAALIAEAARLDELRMEAQEARITAYLATGQVARAVGDLEVLVVERPLRESLWSLLIRGLYQQGRQSDALDAYLRARRVLREELGIDPSPELARLQKQVLDQDPALEATGLPLRGYRLLERVRVTHDGPVFRAIQPVVGRDVEIRVFSGAVASEPDFVRRFEHAARAIASLEHPHIAPVYDYWREPGRAYLVGRHLKGGSLSAVDEHVLTDDIGQAATWVEHVASAVAYAHRQGLAHGSLSAESVMFDEERNAYIVDFALDVEPAAASGADIRSLAVIARRLLPDDPIIESIAERALLGGDTIAEEFSAAARIARGALAPPATIVGERNPYKGLRPFDEPDARDYFGRSGLVRDVVARLRGPAAGAAQFVALVGPSGAGKSSFARAAVLPAIRGGGLAPETLTFVSDMFPGADPFDQLQAAIARVAIRPVPAERSTLESGARGLLDALEVVLPPGARLLLLVDQLEELFTLTESDDTREQFLEALRVATTDPDGRLHVIATLRADFYDRPLAYQRFGALLASSTEALPPLSPDEYELAIRRPAEGVGLRIEAGVVGALIADVVDEPGALPLLEFALTELVEQRDGPTLTMETYRAMGGVAGALSNRADQTFDALGIGEADVARQLFLRLVRLGDGRQDTRRRVGRSELKALGLDTAMVDAVLDAFGRCRILTFDRDPTTREPTVEIAHESLLAAWARLREWIDAAREDLRQAAELARSATGWRASDEDPSFLATGSRLERLADWATGSDVTIGTTERAYLEASVERRDAEAIAERRRLQHEAQLERRSRTRLRTLVAVLAVAALTTMSLAVLAGALAQRAGAEARLSTARELAFAAIADIPVDPERAILLAIEAVRTTRTADGTVLPEAEDALHRAIAASRAVASLPGAGGAVAWGADGTIALEVPSGEVELRRPTDWGTERRVGPFAGTVDELAFSPDGTSLAVADGSGALTLVDVASGQGSTLLDVASGPSATLDEESGRVAGISFSGDGRSVAASWPDEHVVRVFALADGSARGVLLVHAPEDTALSPDGRNVAVQAGDAVRVLDTSTGGQRYDPLEVEYGISGVAWSPDGRWLATVGMAGGESWDAGSGRHVEHLRTQTGVNRLAWSADSRSLATGGTDQAPEVAIWKVDDDGRVTERTLLVSRETADGVDGLAFSPGSDRVIAGATGGHAAKVWDIGPSGRSEILEIPSVERFGDVAFMPDGSHLLAVGADGRMRSWGLSGTADGTPFGPSVGEHSFKVAPDGSAVAMPLYMNGVAAWEIASGERLFEIDGLGWVDDVAWSPDGSDIAVTIMPPASRIVVIDSAGTTMRTVASDEVGPYLTARYDPSGESIAAVQETDSGTLVRFLDPRDGRTTATIPADAGIVAFDPTGTRLATGFAPTRIIALPGGDVVGGLEGDPVDVREIAFDAEGRWLVAALDRAVGVFDADTRSLRLLLRTPDGRQVARVAFSPDGAMMAAHMVGLVSVWALDIDLLLDVARRNVTRSLTDEECRRYLHDEVCPAESEQGTTLPS